MMRWVDEKVRRRSCCISTYNLAKKLKRSYQLSTKYSIHAVGYWLYQFPREVGLGIPRCSTFKSINALCLWLVHGDVGTKSCGTTLGIYMVTLFQDIAPKDFGFGYPGRDLMPKVRSPIEVFQPRTLPPALVLKFPFKFRARANGLLFLFHVSPCAASLHSPQLACNHRRCWLAAGLPESATFATNMFEHENPFFLACHPIGSCQAKPGIWLGCGASSVALVASFVSGRYAAATGAFQGHWNSGACGNLSCRWHRQLTLQQKVLYQEI